MTHPDNTLRARRMRIDTPQQPVVYMPVDCHVCRSEGLEAQSRVRVDAASGSVIAVLEVTLDGLVGPGQVGLSEAAWRRLRDREAVEPYVRKIIVRTIIDHRRLAFFRRESSWSEPPESRIVVDATNATPDRMAVLEALARVPPRQRAVLVLRYWEDLSIDEAAEMLGCSTGTVKSQAARGLQTLRELLAHQFAA